MNYTLINDDAVITEPLNGRFVVKLTDQTLAIGDNVVKADISVFTNDAFKILTTRTFCINVQSTIRNDEAV